MKRKVDYNTQQPSFTIEDGLRQRKLLNNKLIPFNIIIAVICLVAIISLFMGSFWKLNLEYNIDSATLEQLVASGGVMPEGVEIDYDSLDINVKFALALSFEPDSLVESVVNDNETAVSKMIDDAVGNILQTATSLVKEVFKAGVKVAIATALDEVASSEELAGIVSEINMAEVENIVNELFEEEPDTEQIENDLVSLLSAQFTAMGEEFTPEMESQIRDSYSQTITQLSDEEGNFSMYTAIGVMLDEAGIEADVEDQQAIAEEQVTTAVRNMVLEQMDEQTLTYIAIGYKVIGGILIFTVLMWAILLLSSVIHIFSRKKGVKMWYAILWCALPYLLFVGSLNLAIKYGMDYLKEYLGDYGAMLDNVSVKVTSMTTVSAICVAVLILISFCFYGNMRKKARRA